MAESKNNNTITPRRLGRLLSAKNVVDLRSVFDMKNDLHDITSEFCLYVKILKIKHITDHQKHNLIKFIMNNDAILRMANRTLGSN